MSHRRATVADHPAVLSILRPIIAAGETYPYPPDSTDADLARYWFAPTHTVFVAEQAQRIVGSYYLRPNQPGLAAHLCNAGFVVAPRHAGQGIGLAMVGHAQATARQQGYLGMQFNLVVATNVAAIRLWKKAGFAVIGTIPNAFRHHRRGLVAAHIMHKTL